MFRFIHGDSCSIGIASINLSVQSGSKQHAFNLNVIPLSSPFSNKFIWMKMYRVFHFGPWLLTALHLTGINAIYQTKPHIIGWMVAIFGNHGSHNVLILFWKLNTKSGNFSQKSPRWQYFLRFFEQLDRFWSLNTCCMHSNVF